MQQIQLEKTLDVEVIEHQFAELWKQTAGDLSSDEDVAVLRARVANLLVFVANKSLLDEVDGMIQELTAIHPSRVLMMLGDRNAADRDIEMYLASFCQSDKRGGGKRLCCEEITLKAYGKFVAELPSAALPLLVSDLSTFLWWRDALQVSNKVFDTLLQATDRLVIDSAEFENPQLDLIETNRLFTEGSYKRVGISDLNWARLTLWRELLADFYDVPAYRQWLDRIDYARVDYVAPAREPAALAPQALLIAGWLAGRLRWSLASERPTKEKDKTLSFNFLGKGRGGSSTPESPAGQPGWGGAVREGLEDRAIKLDLKRVERAGLKPGRLVQVELGCNSDPPASFKVGRSDDGLHLLAEAELGENIHRGRVLPVRNRSAAQLLSREMEILCNDQIYQESLAWAAKLIETQ